MTLTPLRYLYLAAAALAVGVPLGVPGGVLGRQAITDAAAPVQCGNTNANAQLSAAQREFPADRATSVTVSGTGYQVPPYLQGNDVFGGLYVLFGWVSHATSFGPSTRGQGGGAGIPGNTYAYPGEFGSDDVRDDGTGVIRLVSFTEGGTSGEATPYHFSCEGGNWSATMVVPGAVFSMFDPTTNQTHTYDCTALASGQCGFFTMGAHGRSSAPNERFIPVTFTGAPVASQPAQPGVTSTPTSAPQVADPVDPGDTVVTAITAPPVTDPVATTGSVVTATPVSVTAKPTSCAPEGAVCLAVIEVRSLGSSVVPLVIGVVVVGAALAAWLALSRRRRAGATTATAEMTSGTGAR